MVNGNMTEVTIKVIDEALMERLSRGLHRERRRTDPSNHCGVMKAAEGGYHGAQYGQLTTIYVHYTGTVTEIHSPTPAEALPKKRRDY